MICLFPLTRAYTRSHTPCTSIGFRKFRDSGERCDGAKTVALPKVELPSKLSWKAGPLELVLLAGLNRETIGALADLFQLLFLMNLI